MEQKEVCVQAMIDAQIFTDFGYFNNFRLRCRWLGLAWFPVFMAVFAWINYATGSVWMFWAFLAIGLALPVGYLIFFRVSVKNQIKANKLETPKLAYVVRMTPSRIVVKNDTQEAEFEWDQLYRVFKTKRYVYLYITKARAFILPFSNVEVGGEEALWGMITQCAKPERLKVLHR